MPNWIVCLASGQSTHCSGKILEKRQRGRTLEEGLNRQETLKRGQLKEDSWVSGTVWASKVKAQSVSSFSQ